MRPPPFVGTGGGVSGPPGSVRLEMERLGALGRLAHQRERERVVQDELDRVVREQRKAEENDWEKRLQVLKSKVAAEEQKAEAEKQRTRSLFTHNRGLQAECDRLRSQSDGEQQRLAAYRAQGDWIIADRMSELRKLNDRIFGAKEKQGRLEAIEETSERSREGEESDDEGEEEEPERGEESARARTVTPATLGCVVNPVNNIQQHASRQAVPQVLNPLGRPVDTGTVVYRT